MTIKAIIFDLGGVLIDVCYEKTITAFKQLGARNIDDFFKITNQHGLVDEFEVGKITSHEFRRGVCNLFDLSLSDNEFDQAWGAVLSHFQVDRLALINNFATSHTLFLFSNINEIHHRMVLDIHHRDLDGDDLFANFTQCYFSHLMGCRKPNQDGFRKICQAINTAHGIDKSEILFVDDTARHVESAKLIGLNALLVESNLPGDQLTQQINEEIIFINSNVPTTQTSNAASTL